MLWFTSGINVSDLQSFCDLYILLEHSADNSAHLCIDRLLPGPGNKLAFFYGISDFCHRLHDSICTGTDQTLGCKAAYISRNSGIWDCFFFPDHISQCYENVHEFIDRILIHELDRETNTRKIEIHYSFVGQVDTEQEPTQVVNHDRRNMVDVKSIAI